MKRNRWLHWGILCALLHAGTLGAGTAEAASSEQEQSADVQEDGTARETALPETVVTADRNVLSGGLAGKKAHMGILGDVHVLDIPYSEQSMTQKTIETFGNTTAPLASVLMNDPSIRMSSSSAMYTDFSMRGVNMNGNHFMLNGIPSLFYQFTTPPSHIIERMDITSGPNAAVNGVSMSNNGTDSGATPAPGTINVITKRAHKEPITKYTQTVSGRGSLGEYIDIGRRFGKNDEWGIRINGEWLNGSTSLPGAKNNSQDIFINLDHQDKKSSTNLFFGYWDLKYYGGQRWFTYSGSGGELPHVPSSTMNYDFPETLKWMYLQVLTFNHEQKMNDKWSLFFNGGYSKRDGNKINATANLKFDENGSFTSENRSSSPVEAGQNSYLQIGVSGKVRTGAVQHRLALSIDRSKADYWSSGEQYGAKGFIGGNLYDGIVFKNGFYPIPGFISAKKSWTETNVGITLMDTLSYGKWQIMLAASRKHEHLENFSNKTVIRNDNTLPTWGLVYKPIKNLSLYYGHTESFSRGYVVTNTKYENRDAIMPPVKSKQNEIGVKFENKGLLTTLSYFNMDQGNRFEEKAQNGKWWYRDDGKNVYQGIELSANGRIAPKWTVTGGILYLDAKRDKTQYGRKDGWFVNGVAEWSGVLGVVYQADENLSFIGRGTWVDECFIDNNAASNGRTRIPAYTTLDLGVKYKSVIDQIPVEFSLMCYNALGKDHWMGRGGSTTFGLSMPRTWMFSASASL